MSRRNRSLAALRTEAGFTLLEILIAMFLLVMISIAIYQATTQTFKYREILIRDGDFYNGIRLSLGIFERDIEQLYSPIFMNPHTKFPGLVAGGQMGEIPEFDPNSQQGRASSRSAVDPGKAQALESLLNSELGQVTDYWLGATDSTGIRASRFKGSADALTFVSASHARLYKGSKESTFAKIAYELRSDTSEDAISGTRILVRIEDPNVFDDTEKRLKWAKTYPLLSGVKSLKFDYYRLDTKTWENSWDNSGETQKGLYPDLIRVKIEVTASQRLNFEGTYIFRPEMPYRGLPKTF